MPMLSVNYLAILIATLASMVIGSAWYSPLLFMRIWLKELGVNPDDKSLMEKGKKDMPKATIGQLIASLITAYVLAHFLGYAGATNAWLGMVGGFWAWLGFQATSAASHVFFEKKSWTWFAINAGCSLVTLVVMGAIIGAWR